VTFDGKPLDGIFGMLPFYNALHYVENSWMEFLRTTCLKYYEREAA
jgi:hypothetical protein